MPVFVSPDGNREIHDACPDEYMSESQWISLHPVLATSQDISGIKEMKRVEVNRSFDSALVASLTMPSRSTPPSTVELVIAIADFKADDPAGLVDLCAIHEARRDALLAAIDAATTPEAVQAIAVSYAV